MQSGAIGDEQNLSKVILRFIQDEIELLTTVAHSGILENSFQNRRAKRCEVSGQTNSMMLMP